MYIHGTVVDQPTLTHLCVQRRRRMLQPHGVPVDLIRQIRSMTVSRTAATAAATAAAAATTTAAAAAWARWVELGSELGGAHRRPEHE
jgi:hypothetical protein